MDKYELLRMIESENPMWYQSISDDDPKLIELRKAWTGKSKSVLKYKHKYDDTDENLIELIRYGYSVPELTEMIDAPKSAIHNRVRLNENVKRVWKIAVKARKTLVIEKDDKTIFVIGGLKAAGKALHVRPSKIRSIMKSTNPECKISWYFDCYDTIDELEEYLYESEKKK